MTNMSTTNGATSTVNADGSPKRTKICVYCGASAGNNPIYLEAARQLARVMAANNIGLGMLFINFVSLNQECC